MRSDRLSALVVGGIAWNTMVYVDTFPPQRPHTTFAGRYRDTVGSSGAGKALNLAHLDVDVALWALVGDDAAGDSVRAKLERPNIDLMLEVDPMGTARHINLMDAAGERISIFGNTGSDEYAADIDRVVTAAAGRDIVSISIFNHCRQFLPHLKESGIPLWIDIHDFDGDDPHHAEFIEAADHLTMSSVLLPDWRQFLESRIEAGTTVAVCTHGDEGASGITAADGWVDVPAVAVKHLVDTNGAGDAFFSGFATSWVRGDGLEAAMFAGAEAGAVAVQSPELWPADEASG